MLLLLGAVTYRTFNANFYHLFMNGYWSKWDLWRSHVVQVKYERIVNRKCSGNVSRQAWVYLILARKKIAYTTTCALT